MQPALSRPAKYWAGAGAWAAGGHLLAVMLLLPGVLAGAGLRAMEPAAVLALCQLSAGLATIDAAGLAVLLRVDARRGGCRGGHLCDGAGAGAAEQRKGKAFVQFPKVSGG